MKLTRERKIFGAVLVIALGGLGWDQLRGSSPASADASAEADSLLMATTGSSNKSALHSATAGDEVSLASRLTSLAQATGTTSPATIRDVFKPANTWLSNALGSNTTVAAADKFALQHKLSTISQNASGGGVAVVDGKMLNVGAKIDGYKLISVNRQAAIFQAPDGARAQLKLPTESPAGR